MRTSVSVPNPLFDAAERLARRLRVSRSELYRRALAAYVQSHRDEGVTEALNSVCEHGIGVLEGDFERLQSGSLRDEQW